MSASTATTAPPPEPTPTPVPPSQLQRIVDLVVALVAAHDGPAYNAQRLALVRLLMEARDLPQLPVAAPAANVDVPGCYSIAVVDGRIALHLIGLLGEDAALTFDRETWPRFLAEGRAVLTALWAQEVSRGR